MNKVDFRTAAYFSIHIRITSVFFVFLGLVLLSESLVGGLIMCLISLVFLTTHYRFSVDLDKKVYHDYLWIAGFKNGEKKKYDVIEYVFIKKSSVSQTMHLRVASSTIRKEVYDGYVKFSTDEKVHLLTLDSKGDLMSRLKAIASQLRVRLIDYSEGTPREV